MITFLQGIQGLDDPPPPHPADKPLLKPLSALGKAAASASGVSFLRRTEYMSSNQNARIEPSGAREVVRQRPIPQKRKHTDISHDEPARIVRDIEASFALANDDVQANGEPGPAGGVASIARSAWANPKHPTKPGLNLLDIYPVLPDLEATPDTGSYGVVKYTTNPVANSNTDNGVEVAILRPRDPRPEVMQMWQARKQEREAAGDRAVEQQPYDYDLFLAGDADAVEEIRTAAQDANAEGAQSFEFPRVRTYETVNGDLLDPFEDSVALALVDGESGARDRIGLAKGAYFYPIGARTIIRPARTGWGHSTNSDAVVDMLDVSYRAAQEFELSQRKEHNNSMYEAPSAEALA